KRDRCAAARPSAPPAISEITMTNRLLKSNVRVPRTRSNAPPRPTTGDSARKSVTTPGGEARTGAHTAQSRARRADAIARADWPRKSALVSDGSAYSLPDLNTRIGASDASRSAKIAISARVARNNQLVL